MTLAGYAGRGWLVGEAGFAAGEFEVLKMLTHLARPRGAGGAHAAKGARGRWAALAALPPPELRELGRLARRCLPRAVSRPGA
eukprot:gene13486-9034_t